MNEKSTIAHSREPAASTSIFDLYQAWINPIIRAIVPTECGDTCAETYLYVEEYLIRQGHMQPLYPRVFGCLEHGNYRIISLNHEQSKFYVDKWKTFLRKQRIVLGTCVPTCSFTNIPQLFHNMHEIQFYYKPMMFCPTHGSVHFCIGSNAPCKKCACCKRGEICPFQCREAGYHGICHVSGQSFDENVSESFQTIDDIEKQYASANQHTYFQPLRKQLITHTNQRIKENIAEWIAIAAADTTPLTQSSGTLFAKLMKQHYYICSEQSNGNRIDYFYQPSIEIVRHIHYIQTLNSVPFVVDKQFPLYIFELWSILLFYMNQLLGWEYIITMVAHLSAEFGLQFRHMRLSLRPSFIFPLYRLRHTQPPKKSKKTNVLMKSQMFNNIIYELPYETQSEICKELKKRNFEMFAL